MVANVLQVSKQIQCVLLNKRNLQNMFTFRIFPSGQELDVYNHTIRDHGIHHVCYSKFYLLFGRMIIQIYNGYLFLTHFSIFEVKTVL